MRVRSERPNALVLDRNSPGGVRHFEYVGFWPFATCCTASILGRKRGIAEIDRPTSIAEGDARDPHVAEVGTCDTPALMFN
jgi:hypothetical protein